MDKSNFTVTITRQFGSLGRPIAAKMAEILGIDYYDRDIVEHVAKEMGEDISYISNREERADIKFAWMKVPFGIATSGKQDEIFKREQQVIKQLVEKKSCIIVGRCSDYILQNEENAIHIFIYAPYKERFRNCVDVLEMTEADAKKTIQDVDKMRDNYHKTYAGYLPSDYNHKNIMIDSSLLGVDATAEYLASVVKHKFGLE